MTETLNVDQFDRFLQRVEGLPDVRKTTAVTVRSVHPLVGMATTHVVQTHRQRDEGFTITIERMDAGGHYRIVLPPAVAERIYRQRASLVDRSTPESRARERKRQERERKRQEKERRRAVRTTGEVVSIGTRPDLVLEEKVP